MLDEKSQQGFFSKLIDAVPNAALGFIGTLFALAIVFKVVGIDFAGPINSYTEAQVKLMEAQAQGIKNIHEIAKEFEAALRVQERNNYELARKIGEVQEQVASNEKAIMKINDRVVINTNDIERILKSHR